MLRLKEASKTPQTYPVMVILDNSSLPHPGCLSLLGSCHLITVRLWSPVLLPLATYISTPQNQQQQQALQNKSKKSSFIPGWFSLWYFLPSLLSLPKLK